MKRRDSSYQTPQETTLEPDETYFPPHTKKKLTAGKNYV
jgi:hypothetical protein